MDALVERFAVAPVKMILERRDVKLSRVVARSAAHWAIAVLYQRATGKIARGTSADAMAELVAR